jgi:DNA-directed RNA polymerase subunit RPC12/RpoP
MGALEPAPAPARGVTEPDTVRCPWCGSTCVERIGEWGPQLLTEQYMCLACRSPFEWIRKR